MKIDVKGAVKKITFWDFFLLYGVKRKIRERGIVYRNKTLFTDYNSKVLFIHIPKAAGMSIVDSLYGIEKSHHATALDYFNEDRKKFESCFSFAITRNPYLRLYSAFNYLKSGGMNIVDIAWYELYLSKYKNFEQFILDGGLELAISKNAEHFIPQYKFLFDNSNELLCDYVGKIENIEDVESRVSKEINRNIVFSKKNVVNKNPMSIDSVYTHKMLEVVNKLYEKDFTMLDYEYGCFN
ncbi:hypothetical protein GMES_1046 [Paraglaciecola mesophila KMM 241]|uniref:Sulfotransferase family protein n=1 Tax=Paraglaciecola mesophila KMM 241 TaxID=1128912 RepID=K6ZIY9_9ALTE|nr:sulfotransferase family 2 domain-containing protein [Paraglaciecola mesophila]GAC23345.1 hypothetical protein GMES_1046 [Paraglaciecola mesophila KMM 241]